MSYKLIAARLWELRRAVAAVGFSPVDDAQPEAVEIEVDHWGGEQRECLAHDQPDDDGNTQRPAQL